MPRHRAERPLHRRRRDPSRCDEFVYQGVAPFRGGPGVLGCVYRQGHRACSPSVVAGRPAPRRLGRIASGAPAPPGQALAAAWCHHAPPLRHGHSPGGELCVSRPIWPVTCGHGRQEPVSFGSTRRSGRAAVRVAPATQRRRAALHGLGYSRALGGSRRAALRRGRRRNRGGACVGQPGARGRTRTRVQSAEAADDGRQRLNRVILRRAWCGRVICGWEYQTMRTVASR